MTKRAREGVYKSSRPDADNIGKAVSDAIQQIVFTDDARVADARVVKLYSDAPGLVVEVWALDREPLTEAAE